MSGSSDPAAVPSNPYRADPFWRGKRLTPAQLQIHDVFVDSSNPRAGPRLDIGEVSSASLIPASASKQWESRSSLSSLPEWQEVGANASDSERSQLERLDESYGWMNWLRLHDDDASKKVRWIHVSSTFPEYIQGVIFCGLADWRSSPRSCLSNLRRIGLSVGSSERSSNHGKFFTPFLRSLSSRGTHSEQNGPFLMSMPFLDWTVYPGPAPPLRFQVDDREAFTAARSSRHPLRSLLQYHYRLEDTADRERSQVYARHRPWTNDREIDLKVRRVYGHYPTGHIVDELWILVVDARHIVTFSSNQTWKSRWPAMQLSARIADLSFLGFRRANAEPNDHHSYSAHLHAVVCLHGALGLVHRSFSEGLLLPCTERYAAYMGHLQYRLYRSPTTKLVMELLQLQDELAIVLQISNAQEQLLVDLQSLMNGSASARLSPETRRSLLRRDSSLSSTADSVVSLGAGTPLEGVLARLRIEIDDLTELRTNTNELVTRTVSLVNIRLEDHGQAILVFTLVTIIFLPLSFLASFFGMNTVDIRNTTDTQGMFWAIAAALTVVVVGASSFLAFYGTQMMENFLTWKDSRSLKLNLRQRLVKAPPKSGVSARVRSRGFAVLDVSQGEPTFGVGSW